MNKDSRFETISNLTTFFPAERQIHESVKIKHVGQNFLREILIHTETVYTYLLNFFVETVLPAHMKQIIFLLTESVYGGEIPEFSVESLCLRQRMSTIVAVAENAGIFPPYTDFFHHIPTVSRKCDQKYVSRVQKHSLPNK